MGLRDKLKRLERRSEGETLVARCEVCGEEMRIRGGILPDLAVLEWQMDQEGSEELPADTPADMRWVWNHECDPLCLRDKQTGEHIFGALWERGVLAQAGDSRGA
jgi:hypothetical protein